MKNQNDDFNAPKRRLYLLLTRSLCNGDPLQVLEEALMGGVDLVQLREKPMAREEFAWIHAVWSLCHAHKVPLILNDRIDLAKELGLGWVHLGQEDLKELKEEKALPDLEGMKLGISTHSLEELRASLSLRPSYVGIGPCFATTTKGYQKGLPSSVLKAMQDEATQRNLPAFAIGGIRPENLGGLLDLGVTRVAVSSCILGASSPREMARAPKEQLRGQLT